MNIDNYVGWLEGQLEAAIEDSATATAEDAERDIRDDLPISRIETRRSVAFRMRRRESGIRAIIGLNFSKQYRIKGTQTERLFKRSWQRIKPRTHQHFTTHLNTRLKRI